MRCWLVVQNCLICYNIHVVVIITLYLEHVIKLILRNSSITWHVNKQIDFFHLCWVLTGSFLLFLIHCSFCRFIIWRLCFHAMLSPRHYLLLRCRVLVEKLLWVKSLFISQYRKASLFFLFLWRLCCFSLHFIHQTYDLSWVT